ncbi:MAG: hypothetical protein EBW68_09090, partial [Actinobacteria bacterium]|nr:hypothetical protein [Actinomycetota bacterium]
MNIQNVTQREILDFKKFLSKVHDNSYKPLSGENQSGEISPKSGQSEIKREPAYDYAGYADSVFAKQSKIDAPGYRINMGSDEKGMVDAPGVGGIFNMDASESLNIDSTITRL